MIADRKPLYKEIIKLFVNKYRSYGNFNASYPTSWKHLISHVFSCSFTMGDKFTVIFELEDQDYEGFSASLTIKEKASGKDIVNEYQIFDDNMFSLQGAAKMVFDFFSKEISKVKSRYASEKEVEKHEEMAQADREKADAEEAEAEAERTASLRKKVIRLAYSNPELRKDLLPLLKEPSKTAHTKMSPKEIVKHLFSDYREYQDNIEEMSELALKDKKIQENLLIQYLQSNRNSREEWSKWFSGEDMNK